MKASVIFCCFAGLSACLNAAEVTVYKDSISVTLDEINVTAIKQTNRLMKEPEASTVLSASELEELGIVTMRGISDVVPNFYMPDYGSRITSTIYVRGIGARMDQPSVGLNVDNVPYLNKDAYDFDITDIASVEMFRGPQSTLYGRNTIAGVINITTLSPLRYQGWRLFAELGNGGRLRASAGWYHKFSKDIGLSVIGDYSHLRGFFKNAYNGKPVDKENNFGIRTKFQWNPKENLRIQNTLSANLLRQGGYPYEYLGTGRIEYNDTCFYRRFTLAEGLTVSWTTDKFEFASITSVQHINDNMTLDQDFLPQSFFTLSQMKRETSFTEEVVIKGKAVEDKYKWICGLFGFYKHLDMDAPVIFKDTGIRELIENHRNDANPDYPIEWNTRTFPLNSKFTIPTYGFAGYHESNFTIDNWTFIAGIRLDFESPQLNYRSFCNTGYRVMESTPEGLKPYRESVINIDDEGKLRKHFLTALPKLAVVYSFDENRSNLYVKVSKGYKAGGFNTQMFSDVLQQRLMRIMGMGSKYEIDEVVSYKPEKSWNYEIGGHFSFPKAGLNLELAAFYIDCHDQQLTMFPGGNTTGRIMTNAGKTRSYGAEVSMGYTQVKNLELNLSYGYTNAKFREFFNGIEDFAGNRLPYIPSHTLFLQALYNINLNTDSNRLVFDVNMRGTGPIYWNEENNLKQDFYALLGASATLQLGNFEIKIWGKNLSDTSYSTFYFKSMGNEFLQRGRGVEFGASFRWWL